MTTEAHQLSFESITPVQTKWQYTGLVWLPRVGVSVEALVRLMYPPAVPRPVLRVVKKLHADEGEGK